MVDLAKVGSELAIVRALGASFASPLAAWTEDQGLVVAYEDALEPPLTLGPLDPLVAARIVLGLATSMAEAHRADLVHGLLCPAFVHRVDGEASSARIAGLGLLKLISTDVVASLAGPELAPYLAPEIVRGKKARPQTDVRSLGVIFHALVHGAPPYSGALADVLASASTDALPPLPASVPATLALAIDRATARAPEERFEDARALARAIEEALAQSPRIEMITGEHDTTESRAIEEAGRRSDASWRGRAPTRRREPRFTGALAKEQITFARELHGAAIVDRALAAIAPEDRDDIVTASALSWIRIDAFARFHDALARELGRDVEETHPELVRGGSKRTFGTMWRLLLRVGGAKLVMTRAPVIYDKTYDTGVLETRNIADDGGQFVLGAWPDVPEFVLRGLRAGMSLALENVGRSGVSMVSQRTTDGAIFTARWDP